MMIILFFVGLIIMASAGSISDISNITYLYLVCNVIGGIMMGGSTFFFFKAEERKKNELKLLVGNLSGKEEHENEINILNAIEKVLQEYRETLRTINENQGKIIAGVCDNSEIKDCITAINEMLKECFDSLEKQVATQDSKTAEAVTEKICNLIKCVETMTEMVPISAQNVRDAVENAEKSIKNESTKLCNAVDTLHIDYTEFKHQKENDFAVIIENMTSVSEKLQIQANHLEGLKTEIIDTLRCIEKRIEGVNLLPGEICESVERLIAKFEGTINSIQSDYKNLADDIEEQEKTRTKKFNSIMTEIRDSSEESNEEMTEEIKKLAEQYESFEKTISVIVDQMSHMAEEDIRVMKGFLNG